MLSELNHDDGAGVSVDWLSNFYFGMSSGHTSLCQCSSYDF